VVDAPRSQTSLRPRAAKAKTVRRCRIAAHAPNLGDAAPKENVAATLASDTRHRAPACHSWYHLDRGVVIAETTAPAPRLIVAARLGDDPNTVLSSYAHLLRQSDELAAERVAALLAG